MRVDLTDLITALVGVFLAVLIRYVIPWIRSKTTEQDRKDLLKWTEIAVAAAQQTLYQMDGAQRKQYVLDFLSEHGFDVDGSEVDAAIESAVLQLHESLKEGDKE